MLNLALERAVILSHTTTFTCRLFLSMSASCSGARYPSGDSSVSPSFTGSRTNACLGFSASPFLCSHTRAVFATPHRRSKPFDIVHLARVSPTKCSQN
jgi:hypothetical protein